MIEVLVNQRELQIESKRVRASCIRFFSAGKESINYSARCATVVSTHDVFVLHEHLVVFADGDQENDGGDVLETMDPFLALRSLAAHIEHSARNNQMQENGCHQKCLLTGT